MKLHVESDGARVASIPVQGGRMPSIAADGTVNLGITLPLQARSHWCWAAIGSTLTEYFGAPPLTQAQVAERMTGTDGEGSNKNLELNRVLERVGCHGHWSPGRPTFDRLAYEINRGHPLAVRIEWLRGDAHYVLVTGYNAARHDLEIADSLHGASRQAYDDFPRGYHNGGGLWTETFWTNYMGET
ncbi:papain-like cysteine protease family protein [Gymnodinialimonas sp.]